MAGQRLIIANTTPLINFAEVGRLELLRDLFGEVVVPQAVDEELRGKNILFPAAAVACDAAFIRRSEATNRALVGALTWDLHTGEAECIALARETPSALLLLDDLAARKAARHYGLHFTGTVGCLRLAKDRDLIEALGPVLADLQTKARFWLSRRLIEQVLRDVGELPPP